MCFFLFFLSSSRAQVKYKFRSCPAAPPLLEMHRLDVRLESLPCLGHFVTRLAEELVARVIETHVLVQLDSVVTVEVAESGGGESERDSNAFQGIGHLPHLHMDANSGCVI